MSHSDARGGRGTGPDGDRIQRRTFLRLLTAGFAATLGLLLYPVARFLRPHSTGRGGSLEVVAPYKVNDLREDAAGSWPSPFNFGGKPCLVIKGADGQVRAFNGVCTHVDCTVAFRSREQDIFCNCHNGVYDLRGRNVSGPPPRPLEEYTVTLRGKPGEEEIIVSRDT